MKPDLSVSFAATWAGIPPGMPAGDLSVWLRYRGNLVEYFDRVYFNVRVGEPIPVVGDLPPEIISMAESISRRRIDVVLERPRAWHLLELKYDAGAEALGQILMYKALWDQDPPDDKPVRLFIVSDRANKDLSVACKAYDVELIVV